MPAKLDLLPRKEFEITLEDGSVIKGQFGTWCLKRFCERQKMTFAQLSTMSPTDYSLSHICDMILSAVEHSARKTNTPCSYNEVHVCGWIDEFEGGIASDNLAKLFNHQSSDVLLPADTDEKKTESLSGKSLQEVSTLQEAQ